jgi:hypothetical protein
MNVETILLSGQNIAEAHAATFLKQAPTGDKQSRPAREDATAED